MMHTMCTFLLAGMTKLVFDKLCDRKTVYDDYFYRKVLYNYEFLEDYQDVYSEFPETITSTDAASVQQESSRMQTAGLATAITVKPRVWGPKVYRYKTHPLYLMVSSAYKQ